ncbi:MAG: mannose-1-phosphate guanylyltransferase [Caldilineales bacterium]|nr:mannose-1-phosphate guanylyltransferase [Caldilineales bacterium]
MPSPHTEHLYPVILAGGVGSRLWPRSRRRTPKQFLDLAGTGRTMLQEAYDRMTPLVPPDRIYVVTGREYVPTVTAQLPALPTANIIGEPVARGSAAAIGLAAIHLQARDPDAVMAVLTADHLIAEAETLRRILVGAAELAQQGKLITLGIKPTFPETGYGYIEMGEELGCFNGMPARRVRSFREKPDRQTAEAFLRNGNYAWNSGMFIWRVDTILAALATHMPALHAALQALAPALHTAAEADAFRRHWFPLDGTVTIDYGVMERATDVAVFPADLGWNDIGSWAALLEVLPKDDHGNVVQARHFHLDSRNVLVFSRDRLIATIGLQDMVIVDTGDVILVMPVGRAQEVKQLLDALKAAGLEGYLE